MSKNNSLGDYILIDPMETPTAQQILDAVAVLKRCEDLFRRMRGKKDPPPESMEMVASFLETLVNNHKERLKGFQETKDTEIIDEHISKVEIS